MRVLFAAAALLAGTAAGQAQMVDVTDLWMACDLAQIDAGGDAPMAAQISTVRLVEQPDARLLRVLADDGAGGALYCELEVEVTTFRHNSETIIGD